MSITYQLNQPDPITMQDILKNRLHTAISNNLIRIMESFNEKEVNIKDFASEITDQVYISVQLYTRFSVEKVTT